MNGLDLVVLLGALAAAGGGWTLGFLRRLGGWLGMAGGCTLAVALLPFLRDATNVGNDRVIIVVGALFLIALATTGQAIGERLGSHLRAGVDTRPGRYLDSLGGSLLGLVGVLVVTWLLFPLLSGAQGWPSQAARGSHLTKALIERLPGPPPQITELERALAGGDFPRLFDRLNPAPVLAQPPQVELQEEVFAQALKSIVRIESPACGRIQNGSGFFVAPGLVATNAHVVAGAKRSHIEFVDGVELPARVMRFDAVRDLALLAVDSKAPALPLGNPKVGDQGLVMGFPGGGPFDPSPFALAQQVRAQGYDIYDRERVERSLLILSSALQPGDSGSAILRSDGAVIGVAVAIAPDRANVAYGLDAAELAEVLRSEAPAAADTGPCR